MFDKSPIRLILILLIRAEGGGLTAFFHPPGDASYQLGREPGLLHRALPQHRRRLDRILGAL